MSHTAASDRFTALDVEFIDGSVWLVVKPFAFRINELERVTVPMGFVTDFASIPRALWSLLPPAGSYAPAAVVHDFLYQHRTIEHVNGSNRLCERGDADSALRDGMDALGVGKVTRWVIYSGVRVGGWKIWHRYRSSEAKPA